FSSRAQTNIVTLTNLVTVTVTNVVTITNIVASAPAVPEAGPKVKKVPKYPWESSVSAGLTLTRGNSHTLLYEGDIQTAKKTPDNEYSLGAGGAYGGQGSQTDVNNYHAYGQWNHLFNERLYDYVRAEAKRDVVADLDYRVNIGPGIGYYLIKGTNTTLATEAGAGYQYEHLDDEFNSFATFRLAENFEHKFNARARFWQKLEWVPQVDEVDNYLVNFEVGIETGITKSLSLRTYLVDNYATQPAPGRLKNDVKIVSAIAYKF
ncbi:MAG TPA: DUF481 domain-containing protein, partial [Candidatus Binatia bacterium]|nr:DUF481 domain-containing protein [Candidatus Binatia bacterium]